MTKEDIVRKHYENKFAAPPYDKSVNRGMIFDYVAPAMDEYAHNIAISFAEWAAKELYDPVATDHGWRWDNLEFQTEYTTTELYQLFLQQNKQ